MRRFTRLPVNYAPLRGGVQIIIHSAILKIRLKQDNVLYTRILVVVHEGRSIVNATAPGTSIRRLHSRIDGTTICA